MTQTLEGFFGKLGRAKQENKALYDEIESLLNDYYAPGVEIDPKTDERVVRAYVIKDPPPFAEWSIRVGEIVHNLRSALDHLAYQLARHGAGGHTLFLIADSPDKWRQALHLKRKVTRQNARKLRWMHGMATGAVAAIERLQPYHGGDRVGLRLLRDLSNWDKHRLLQTAAFVSRVSSIDIHHDLPGYGIPPARIKLGRLYDGAEVMRFYLPPHPDGERAKVNVEAEIQTNVVFEKGTAAENRPVAQTLLTIAEFIETDVWLALERFLPEDWAAQAESWAGRPVSTEMG